MNTETSGLYIHVPFCYSRCSYCAFYSESGAPPALLDRYCELITEEIRILMDRRTGPYSSVYIGGGNPGMLSPQVLISLASILTRKGDVQEFTIEMNPESLTDRMTSIFDHGFNRLSVGIQSLHEQHLDTLGRSASLEATVRALKTMNTLSRTKHVALSADLMTCIPSQTKEDSIVDIERILETAEPGHLSLYNLTYEEGTELMRQKTGGDLIPFDEEMERDMLLTLWDHLEGQGFHQYEISNFSRSRTLRSQHNLLYWNDGLYDAVGPTAVGVIERDGRRYRSTGAADLATFVGTPLQQRYGYQELTDQDRIAEYILSAVRTTDGINTAYLKDACGFDFSTVFAQQLSVIPHSLWDEVSLASGRFTLTREGRMLCDSITRGFLNAL